jgi:hypothetical protein
MTNVPSGLLLLVVCTFPTLSIQQTTQMSPADDVNSLTPISCQNTALANGLVEWQEQIAPSNVSIEWGYGNVSHCSLWKVVGDNKFIA